MRVGIFVDGTFIPERDGASTRFSRMPRYLTQEGMHVTVFHCYRGWSDLARIAREPYETYFFPPEVYYSRPGVLLSIMERSRIDIVQMNDAETIERMGYALARELTAPIVYEAHYHTSTLASALCATPARVERLRRTEREVSEFADHLIVFTDEDRDRWTSLSGCAADRISVVPFGIEEVQDGPYTGGRQGLVFIGNLYFEPNRRAVKRLAADIAPAIRAVMPEIPITVIGDIPEELRAVCNAAGLDVTGEVRDVQPWLARAAVGVAPVTEASGVRVKILLCLAAGMPVVSLAAGAEGIGLPGLFVEDDNAAVATRCLHILQNPSQYSEAVRLAGARLREGHLWPDVARKAATVYRKVMEAERRSIASPHRTVESGLPIWIEEVLRKGRFSDADTTPLGSYRFGLAAQGDVKTYP